MKKKFFMFVSFLMLIALIGSITIKADGEPPKLATLVVHYHAWDNNYEDIGAHTWDIKHTKVGDLEVGPGGTLPSGTDTFGIYFEMVYDINQKSVGFIPVAAKSVDADKGTIAQDWDNKKSADDVVIDTTGSTEGAVTHVYVFEGTKGKVANAEEGEVPYLKANPEAVNMVLVYADAGGNYEEKLGIHSWNGWTSPEEAKEPDWASPAQVFKTVGYLGTSAIKAVNLGAPVEKAGEVGLLIYAGGDDSKHTGDVKFPARDADNPYKAGDIVPIFVLNAGAGYTGGENIYVTDEEVKEFSKELTTFRFDLGSYASGTGTFAANPTTVVAKFNRAVVTGIEGAETEEAKEVVRTNIKSYFTIEEVEADDKGNLVANGNKVEIKSVNFNEFSNEASEFVLELETPLDATKRYQIRYDQITEIIPDEPLVSEERTIKFTVTVPEGTEQVFLAGNFTGWNAVNLDAEMTKVEGEANKFEFEIKANATQQTLEYKYLCGQSWNYEELDAEGKSISNRKLEIVKGQATYEQVDEVVMFKDGKPAPTEDNPTPEADPKYAGLPADAEAKELGLLFGDGAAITETDPKVSITFNVTVPEGTSQVYVAGSFQSWTAGAANAKLALVDGKTNEYTLTVEVPVHVVDDYDKPLTVEYKYLLASDWKYEEVIKENRSFTLEKTETGYTAVTQNDTVEAFKDARRLGITLENTPTPVPPEQKILEERTIKFTVTVPEGTEQVFLAGNLTNWDETYPRAKMTKVEGEANKFELEIKTSMVQQVIEYKYLLGQSWGYEELDAEGKPISNRKLEIVKGQQEYTTEDTVIQFKESTDPIVAALEYPEEVKAADAKPVQMEGAAETDPLHKVKFVVTVPEGTRQVYLVGNMQGWQPGNPNTKLTLNSETNKYEIELDIKAKKDTVLEYKFVEFASWDHEEVVGGNRTYTLLEQEEVQVVEAEVSEFKDPVAAGPEFVFDTKETEPWKPEGLYAKAELEMDTEAPEFIFLTDFDKEEDGKGIIYIKLGSNWQQDLFPQFEVNDNRDGNIKRRVYVPGAPNEKRVLDTGKEGDYEILLRVEDDWGHVTEKTFIFRVVKKIPRK